MKIIYRIWGEILCVLASLFIAGIPMAIAVEISGTQDYEAVPLKQALGLVLGSIVWYHIRIKGWLRN